MLEVFSLTPMDVYMIPIGTVLIFLFWRAFSSSVLLPFINLSEVREEKTSGALTKAGHQAEEAASIEAQVEAQRAETRFAAMKEKNEFLTKIRAQAASITEKAETESQTFLKVAREDIAKEVKTYEQSLLEQTKSVTTQVGEKIMGGAW